ncbi:hypothetical protein PRIPAC_72918 [Pristionchus pacificus]|uniref:Zinc finger protein n=1 Tax=Pristionchus pacificus TaxID=54126 RepID=A0A2A6CT01_PRIPA|nr:hypothetical protein PRIPAC_72918 [Pristionchus pacificus]|eukprot:PDM81171.1 zinc finger protein [Pristionchus pacificus]
MRVTALLFQEYCATGELQVMQQFEECGRVAHILQSSDPTIGGVLSKSVNLLFTSLRDGIVAPTSLYAASSLLREREDAVQFDCNKNDPIRFLVYEISNMMGTLIKNCNEPIKESVGEKGGSVHIKNELIEEPSTTFPEDRLNRVFSPVDDPVESVTEMQHYDSIHQPVVPMGDDSVGFSLGTSFMNIFTAHDGVKPKQPVLEETFDEFQDELFIDEKDEEIEDEDDSNSQGLEDSIDQSNEEQSLDSYNDPGYLGTSVRQPRKRGRPSKVSAENNEKVKRSSTGSHKCTICAKVFPLQRNLRDHMLVHTGERSYACSHCSKAYKASNKLARHKRTAHGLNQFICEKCGIIFPKKYELTAHVTANVC